MKTGTVYTVTTKYGTDGLYTRDELVDYCRSSWPDLMIRDVTVESSSLSDDEIVLQYFEAMQEYYYGDEYYDVWTVTEDMLTDDPTGENA